MMFRNCFIVCMFLQLVSMHSQNLNDKNIKVITSFTFEKITLKNIPAEYCEFKIFNSTGTEVKKTGLIKQDDNMEFVISVEDLELGAYSYIITYDDNQSYGNFIKDWFDADLLW